MQPSIIFHLRLFFGRTIWNHLVVVWFFWLLEFLQVGTLIAVYFVMHLQLRRWFQALECCRILHENVYHDVLQLMKDIE